MATAECKCKQREARGGLCACACVWETIIAPTSHSDNQTEQVRVGERAGAHTNHKWPGQHLVNCARQRSRVKA